MENKDLNKIAFDSIKTNKNKFIPVELQDMYYKKPMRRRRQAQELKSS